MSRYRTGRAAPFLLAFLLAIPTGMAAQEPIPKRPRLPDHADTNSATAYYYYGLQRLREERGANEAADAFQWAARLAPDWADPFYALRVALLLSRPERLGPLMEGVAAVIESPEVRRADSLRLHAMLLDPFVHEDLEREIIMRYLIDLVVRELRRQHGVAAVERMRLDVEYEVRSYLRMERAAGWRAWLAYSDRRWDDAVRLSQDVLKQIPSDDHQARSGVHAQRARAFHLGGHTDSAVADLRRAIDELDRRDERSLMRVYESKALLEHSLGVVLETARDPAGARAAYGRALVEDLTFHPAHLRLAGLLAAEGDTAGARAELELALQVAPGSAVARLLLADHQYRAATPRAALETLEPLLESEPYWPEPYLLRARAFDQVGERESAIAQYSRFLQLSEARDDRRGAVEQRIAQLRGS